MVGIIDREGIHLEMARWVKQQEIHPLGMSLVFIWKMCCILSRAHFPGGICILLMIVKE